MLLGQYSAHIAPNRRVAVPAKFLKELGDRLIVAKWYEECLVLVGEEGWMALLNRLTGKPEIITAPIRDTDRFIMGSAYEVEADFQGRIIIPTLLANYAGIGEEVTFLGLGDRVEVWDLKNWGKREKTLAKSAAELIERLAREK